MVEKDRQWEKMIPMKLKLLGESFEKVLYEDDEVFLKNMQQNHKQQDIRKYQHWEWTQGVGLYGFWKMYEATKKQKYLGILEKYYDNQLDEGLPPKNVNTVTPLLTLSCLGEETGNKKYLQVCDEWAEWIFRAFPRTKEGGFQHITSDSVNEEELWDDTLFMTVLFLAHRGKALNREDYIEEAIYQFLIHIKYLVDRKTNLWFHGWSFKEKGHFAGALWGRGNSWITAAIPEFLSMGICSSAEERFLRETLISQIEALKRYQDKSGMWHTLIDDPTSYLEASATSGFGYGMLCAVKYGYIGHEYDDCIKSAVKAVTSCVNEEGIVSHVSYGTPMGRKDKSFYKEIPLRSMPYGQAMAMLLLTAYQKHRNIEKVN